MGRAAQPALPLERAVLPGQIQNEPTEEGALRDRIEKLKWLVGKLTLENEILKRGLENSLSRS